jgi:hypothetical protein
MRRVLAIAAAATTLAGCSSFSSSDTFSYFRSTPPTVQLQLESSPPGADARTSLGPGCKTPCRVSITPPDGGFTVSYSMGNMPPISVPVQVIREPGGTFSADTFRVTPNPVVAELRPPPPPPTARKPMRPKRKKPRPAPADPAAAQPPQ